jgi:SET domain-containing protein
LKFTEKCIYPNLIVKPAGSKGLGVFTQTNLKPGVLLMRYSGKLEYSKDTPQRDEQSKESNDDHFTLFKTNKKDFDRIIVPTKVCNMAIFLNTSEINKNNCRSITIINDKEEMKVLLYTWKKIKKNEELTYNYNGSSNDYDLI